MCHYIYSDIISVATDIGTVGQLVAGLWFETFFQ